MQILANQPRLGKEAPAFSCIIQKTQHITERSLFTLLQFYCFPHRWKRLEFSKEILTPHKGQNQAYFFVSSYILTVQLKVIK